MPDSSGKDLEHWKTSILMPADGALSEAVKTCDLTMEGVLSLSQSIENLCDRSSLCSPQEKKLKWKANQRIPRCSFLQREKKKIKMKQSKMPQKLQKEVSTDCRLLPSALPHCPRSAEGWECSGVIPEGSCSLLTYSSIISNILVDIQPKLNAASSSSKSLKTFSKIFAASSSSVTTEKKGVPEFLDEVPTRVQEACKGAVTRKTEHPAP